PPATGTRRPAGRWARSRYSTLSAVKAAPSPRIAMTMTAGTRSMHDARARAGTVSNILTLDLDGERLDLLGDTLQMRVDLQRLAEREQRSLVLADVLHDRAEPGQRTEMPRLEGEHLGEIGERVGIVLLEEEHGGAPVPRFHVIGL